MIESIFHTLGKVLELFLSYRDRRQEKLRIKEKENETKQIIARTERRRRAKLLREKATAADAKS